MSDRAVNPDGVDDDMKRYQWVCWGHDGKAPTDPQTGGYARHNDAATWGSWDEALAMAERKEYGVGFPFQQAAPFVGLDIDVPHSDEWVPDFDRIAGALVERSMSGNYHVLLRDVEVLDWWTDLSGDGQHTDEIGVYEDSKYMTVSGDTIEGHGAPIEEVSQFAFEAWLKDAWLTWHEHHLDVEDYPDEVPTPPWEADTDSPGTGVASEASRSNSDQPALRGGNGGGETIDDLLRRQTDAAMPSVHDVLSGSYPEGERISHPVHGSSNGNNFKIDSGGETWVCFRSGCADRKNGVTGNALHLLGIDAGIIDCGEWESGGLGSDTWYAIFEEARERGFDIPRRRDVIDSLLGEAQQGDDFAEASADGGTATESEGEHLMDGANDHHTAEDAPSREENTDPWSRVRAIYEDEKEPNSVAHSLAVNLLLDELPVFTARETDRIYAYDDETGYYHEHGSPEVKRHLVDHLGHAYRTKREHEILARLRGKTYVRISDVGAPDGLLCVSNGVLDLRGVPNGEPELVDHDPEYRFLTGLPVAFDPDADCPRFRELVTDVVNESQVETLQEYVGYCLRSWDATFKRAAVCLGPKDSGKSTVLNVVAAMLGDERNVSNQNLYALMNTRWGTAQLHGKMANITNELGTQALKNIGLWKTLTGGDRLVDAERKGEQKFQFRPTTKHMFATNHLPPADGADEAFHERFLHILFPKEVPPGERVRNLDQKIIDDELPGVLNWAIEGYRRLMQQDGFDFDPLVGEKRERWEAYGNSIERFKHNCLDLTGSHDDVIVKAVGYDFYTAYCEYASLDVESQTKVTQKLKEDKHINDGRRKAHPEDKRRTAWVGATYNAAALDELGFDPGSKLDELRSADDSGVDEDTESSRSHTLGGFD